MMKVKSPKFLSLSALLLSFFMLFSIISPNIVYAKTINNDDQTIEILANELEFYFSKVGHLDENNNYIITNPKLLQQRANSGDEGAKKLYNAYLEKTKSSSAVTTKSLGSFGTCVLKSYLGPLYDLLDGKYACEIK